MPKKTPPRKDQNRVPRAPRISAPAEPREAERIAKVIARAGLGSRREIEEWILEGRVVLNGEILRTPAVTVTAQDEIIVDGKPLPDKERTRLFLYHKPKGVVTTNFDPEGRPTLFEILPAGLPRLVSVGRLDLNTEGLILLTNDGGLARILELPETGWLRRYRVRAKGEITQDKLDALIKGITVEGVHYGPIEAVLDRVQGSNVWITLALREGKNREVRNVLGSLGLEVNRLIRLSYGPFQLGEIAQGEAEEIRTRVLADQIGPELAAAAGADFTAPIFDHAAADDETEGHASKPAPGEHVRKRGASAAEPSPEKTIKAGILSDRKGRKFLVQRVRSNEVPEAEPEARPERVSRRERPSGERFSDERPRREGGPGTERPTRRNASGENTFRARPKADRPERSEGDRPLRERPARRDAGDGERSFRPRPEGDRPFRERGPRDDRADRPQRRERPEGERGFRPRPSSDRAEGDRPFRERPARREQGDGERSFRPRPEGDSFERARPGGDRPFRERPEGDKPFRARGPRREGGDAERSFRQRPEGDRPFRERGPREERTDRPARRERPEGDRPFRERPEGDKPFRARGPRREGGDTERSFRPRPEGDRPEGKRSREERPFRARSEEDRPAGGRPPRRAASSERPYTGRVKSEGHRGGGKGFGGKPSGGGKPRTGGKPGGKPGGGRPSGGRPRGPKSRG